MTPIDSKLKDLLVREAHLRLSRAQLTPIWADKEAALRAVQMAKPKFWPVFSKRARLEYEAREAAAQQVVDVMRQGMAVLDRIEPQLKKLIEERIEGILRDDCPEYVKGLATLNQKEDWNRCLDRFAERIDEFTRSVGNVRNLACSGYSRQANIYSEGAVQAFALAVDAARKVDAEVVFANKIADTQARMFVDSGFVVRPLPRLKATDFAAWVTRINSLSLADAQVQFDLLFEQTKKLLEVGIPELRGHAQGVDEMQVSGVRNFLFARWEQFRAEIASGVYRGDTERSVAETEEMLLGAMRNTAPGGDQGQHQTSPASLKL